MASRIDSRVIEDAEQLVSDLKSHSGSPLDQTKLLQRVDSLRCRLQQGPEAMMFHAFPFQILPAIKLCLDFGVFDAAPLESGIAVDKLAGIVKLDAALLRRYVNLLLTQGIFVEVSSGVTMQFPQWWKASDYLKTHSYTEAQEASKAPYSWALGKEGTTYYEAIEEDPLVSDTWHKAMIMLETTQPITGMFPFHSMKTAVEAEPQRPFVVDVGGGRGNALKAIMGECGGSYGAKMILQDFHGVLEGFQDSPKLQLIRAERRRLRKWLATNIPIQWGRRVSRIEHDDSGVRVHFEDGSSAHGDILVGADGINSQTRESLLQRPGSDLLRVVPLATVVGQLTLSGEAFKRQLRLGHSGYMCIRPDLGFTGFVGLHHVLPDGLSGRYYWNFMEPDAQMSSPNHWLQEASGQDKLDHVLKAVADLPDSLREIFEMTPVEGIKPESHVWRDIELESQGPDSKTWLQSAALSLGIMKKCSKEEGKL
ncbi:hypothetical protein GGR56DRAFT_679072 [Xylariaceae sp. FL0804]|nr:hypothetical protein GGR56DRAFT_679072 [Xylariaceae sp. FL0804]